MWASASIQVPNPIVLWRQMWHQQCCGSGSGSVGYVRILGLPDPELSSRSGSGSGSFPLLSKNCRKSLISAVYWLLYNFLSLKTDVNVPSQRNKQKNLEKTYFLFASWKPMTKRAGSRSGSHWYGSGDPDADPHQNVADPNHWALQESLMREWIYKCMQNLKTWCWRLLPKRKAFLVEQRWQIMEIFFWNTWEKENKAVAFPK